MGANPEVVRKFFDQLEQVLYDLNIVNPQQIWNCDESGCQDVPKEDEVVGETGVPQYRTVPKEQGETSTILTFANAAGLVVPPVIIHKGGKVSDTWQINCPVGVMVRASPKGWINCDIFFEYTVRWIRFMKTHSLLGKRLLLLLDAHKSHVYNIRFILICKRFNIDVLAIPSHTSHILQPLDSVPFANLKTAWNEQLIDHLFRSVGLGFSKMEFFEVFIPAWKKSMTPQNIRAGFRETGICPFNPLMIQPSSLGPSEPTDNLARPPCKQVVLACSFLRVHLNDFFENVGYHVHVNFMYSV